MAIVGSPVALARHADERLPAADQATTVLASLLNSAQAKRATRFASPLAADPMAGPDGRSCYAASGNLTCDAWFTSEKTSSPYPVGVSITVTASPADARTSLAGFAATVPDPNRPGDRVLSSTPTVLVSYGTGLAVGADLRPAVSVTVQQVHGSLIIMGTCQVEKRRARLSAMRTCADRLQSAQADQAARLGQG